MTETVDQFARSEIQVVRSEVHDIQTTLTGHGHILTEISTKLENNKPTGLGEILRGGITLAVFIGSLVGGIAYVVSAMSESRLTLIEYRIEKHEQKLGWKPSVSR